MNSHLVYLSGSNMHTASIFFTGIITGILTTLLIVNNNDHSTQKNTDESTVINKINRLESKIDDLQNHLHTGLINNNNPITLNNQDNLDNKDTSPVTGFNTSEDPVNSENTEPQSTTRITQEKEKIINKISSNDFDLLQFYSNDTDNELSDKEKQMIASELIKKVNTGQLSASDIFK